jgi:hypothetical protein
LRRYGRYIHIDEERLRLGQYLFARYGAAVVFFGRFKVLRALAALLATTTCRGALLFLPTPQAESVGPRFLASAPICLDRGLIC